MGNFNKKDLIATLESNAKVIRLLSTTEDVILFIIVSATYLLAYTAIGHNNVYYVGANSIEDACLNLIVRIRNILVHYKGNKATLYNHVNHLHNILNNMLYADIHSYEDITIQTILVYLKEHNFKESIYKYFN